MNKKIKFLDSSIKHLIVELKDNIDETNFIIKNNLINIIHQYDWYLEAIDDPDKYRKTDIKNQEILLLLKNLGVISLIDPNYSFHCSSFVKKIEIEDK